MKQKKPVYYYVIHQGTPWIALPSDIGEHSLYPAQHTFTRWWRPFRIIARVPVTKYSCDSCIGKGDILRCTFLPTCRGACNFAWVVTHKVKRKYHIVDGKLIFESKNNEN